MGQVHDGDIVASPWNGQVSRRILDLEAFRVRIDVLSRDMEGGRLYGVRVNHVLRQFSQKIPWHIGGVMGVYTMFTVRVGPTARTFNGPAQFIDYFSLGNSVIRPFPGSLRAGCCCVVHPYSIADLKGGDIE